MEVKPSPTPGIAHALALIPFQPAPARPLPTRTLVSYIRNQHSIISAIYRQFVPGESSRCRRCPSCSASGDCCLIQVERLVPRDEAPSFSLVDLGAVVRKDL